MKAIVLILLGFALFAFGGAATAQRPVEGLYIVDMMETASGLELTPDGRFRWMFTTGALDMTAEGRWRLAEDGAVLLDTEPPVEPPRFEYLGSGREEAPALVVRIADARGRTPVYLDAEAEYDSGEPGYARLEEDAYRFEPEPGRRIVAIRIGSAGFRFWSERYEVPADANVMRFRFFPGDLGRADFRGERATIDGDTLTLSLMGSPIVYRRLTDEENQAVQAAMAEVADMVAGAGAEGEAEASYETDMAAADPAPPLPVVGPVELAIGEAIDPALARSMYEPGDGLLLGSAPLELRVRFGDRSVDFGRVGGRNGLGYGIRAVRPGRQVEALGFSHQDRLLTAVEALERARELESQLREAGFETRPVTGSSDAMDPFVATVHARDGDQTFMAGGASIRARDWSFAARLLADAEAGIMVMHLFSLKAGDVHATALLQNNRHVTSQFGGPPEPAATDGREWLLDVTIELDPALVAQRLPPAQADMGMDIGPDTDMGPEMEEPWPSEDAEVEPEG